ncbi:MAG: hypothetical protein WBC19_08885 [Pyrinomonadaceae bacterium]|nr:hypothetical protein [Chloracidobacterium sp.]
MTLRTIIPTILFLIVSATGIFSQTTDKITPQEYIEANELSHKFSDRLFKTKDIEPLIKEYFAKDFIERSFNNEYESAIFFLTKDEIPRNRTSKFKRFYVEQMNFMVLMTISAYASPDIDFDKVGDNPEEYFPRPAPRELKRNPYTRALFERFDGGQIESKVLAEKEKELLFDNYLRSLERMNRILRKSTANIVLKNSKRWKENLAFVDVYLSTYKPRNEACDRSCYGFPKGTQLIYVNIPLFCLVLTRLDGKSRVINFQSFFR